LVKIQQVRCFEAFAVYSATGWDLQKHFLLSRGVMSDKWKDPDQCEKKLEWFRHRTSSTTEKQSEGGRYSKVYGSDPVGIKGGLIHGTEKKR